MKYKVGDKILLYSFGELKKNSKIEINDFRIFIKGNQTKLSYYRKYEEYLGKVLTIKKVHVILNYTHYEVEENSDVRYITNYLIKGKGDVCKKQALEEFLEAKI